MSAAILDHALSDGDSTRLKERDIPFVMFSGYPSRDDACKDVPHLAKPSTHTRLLDAVRAPTERPNGQQSPIEITELQAKEIADEAANGPSRAVVLNVGGKTFDVRHLDQAELIAFLAGLTGRERH